MAAQPNRWNSATAGAILYSTNGTSWTTIGVLGSRNNQQLTIPSATTFYWRVRTKGAHADFSDYTMQQHVAATAPVVSISLTNATAGSPVKIEDMPISYALTFSNAGYSFVSADIAVSKDGRTVYSETTSSLTGEISTDEFIPSNGETYTITATVRSSSSLQATTSTQFKVAFIEPAPGNVEVVFDSETGFTALELTIAQPISGQTAATDASVYRLNVDGSTTKLAENVQSGVSLLDKYAPLNREFSYIVVTHAASGAISQTENKQTLKSSRAFCYSGDVIAWAEWNPTCSYSIKSNDAELVYYDGRKLPVMYKGVGIEHTVSVGFDVLTEQATIDAFKQIASTTARCIYKGADGEVFHSYIDVSGSMATRNMSMIGSMNISLTRIDGGDL